jgi:FMN phosphatase YigB (HAD superfamily)
VRALAIVHGVAADVPADHLTSLARAAGVAAVTADRKITLAGSGWDDSVSASPYAWTSQATSTWAQTGNKGTGIGVAVLTNGDPHQQRLKLQRTGLLGHFDRVLTPTEVGAPKPDVTAFVNACAMLAADPATTAYVGDNLAVDAVGAAAAGLRGIWLDRPESDATLPPAVTRITSLSALAASLL